MVDFELEYKNKTIVVQAEINEKFEEVIKKFKIKNNMNENNLCYLLNGKNISPKDIIKDIINNLENEQKQIKILVKVIEINNENIIISENIICPKCKEICKYKIKDYKIKLYDCKYGHINENIKLDEFINTQKIDISKIICDICKNSRIYKKNFFKCYECNKNICQICKSNHDKTHSIINYDTQNYTCNKHNEISMKYCKYCKIDICSLCMDEHKTHETQNYEEIKRDIKETRNLMNKLKNDINKFKYNIKEIIKKLNIISEYMDIYYNINNNIIENYENDKNLNYNKIQNLNNIYMSIYDEIKTIKDKYDYGNNLNTMLYLYSDMVNKNEEIELYYKPKEDNEEKVKIFDKEFINNNRDKCKIIYENYEYDLTEYFNDITYDYNNKDSFNLKLRGVNNITNTYNMFNFCNSLQSLEGSKWNTINITNMKNMFGVCNSLSSLSGISNWDTSNVSNMSFMFNGCHELSVLPDISNWNTSNVDDMSFIFYGCSSLISLPDISKWDVSNVTDMRSMFNTCSSLSLLPDISKWNTSNVTSMRNMFLRCRSLSRFPDISNWNTSNVTIMMKMFYKCSSLSSLPDISKWDIKKVDFKDLMFDDCNELLFIPSKFNE